MSENKVIFVRSPKGDKSGGDLSSSENDIWDDTLLVKAYDNAIQLTQKNFLNKGHHLNSDVKSSEKTKDKSQNWKVGDKCRCKYSEDLKYYEAEIIKILGSTGMCVVKYVGYENEETVYLRKLQPSAGQTARNLQCKQAAEDNQEKNSAAEHVSNNLARKSQSDQKKSSTSKNKEPLKKSNGFSDSNFSLPFDFPIPQMGSSSIPPPPLPHIFNNLQDDNETEAMNAMLMSWYMSGYHTGFYQGLKAAKKH